jgi:hypothetical protein
MLIATHTYLAWFFLDVKRVVYCFGEIMMDMSTCNSNRWNQKETELFAKEPAEACERNSGEFLCW